MLISPAERAPFTSLGKTSSVPEDLGVDFLIYSTNFGVVGVQRKEFSDLVASLSDGRVSREVLQMRDLDIAIWLIEGKPIWTTDGQLLDAHTTFTRDSFQGVLLSLLSQGFWVVRTETKDESVAWLRGAERWLTKEKHNGLVQVPAARSMLGPASDRDWQVHLLKGLPGIGHERARELVDHYKGLPFQLKEGVKLSDVKGVGSVLEKRITRIFK